MSWSVSIRVMDDKNRPVNSKRITIDFGILNGVLKEYTDSEGWATFTNDHQNRNNVFVKSIYIGSEEVDSSLEINNGETKSYTI